MFREFKAFVMKRNVLDLAVAVIIGAAFGAIVTSLVNDIVMLPIGMLFGHMDFRELFISLNGQSYATLAAAKAAAAPVIACGRFLNTVINFLSVAFVIFLVVRTARRLQRPPDSISSDNQGLLLLFPANPDSCSALPALHLATPNARVTLFLKKE